MEVIGSGDSMDDTCKQAEQKGFTLLFLMKVPRGDISYIPGFHCVLINLKKRRGKRNN